MKTPVNKILVNRFITSFAQQRLWFIDQYEPGSALYNMPVAWRVVGELDLSALEFSFNEIIRRHEVLRTTFEVQDDVPVQIIAHRLELSVPVIDLTDVLDSKEHVRVLIQEEAQRPFDLAQGPLIRVGVIKLGQAEHILQLTLHHIISDGWSMSVLVRELNVVYASFSQGLVSPLQDLTIQYGDFAVWQRDWLQGEVLQRQLGYWRQKLEGSPPLLDLPTDRPRPVTLSHQGSVVEFEFDPWLCGQLRQLSGKSGTSLFMTMATAFNVLLSRYSRQNDISIGYPMANRNRTEIEGLIGFFVNTLVLRTSLDPAQDFESLLRQVRASVLDADAHQDLPFEKLVEELQPERATGHSPLFQVMLAFNNNGSAGASLKLSELQVERLKPQTEAAKFDLTLHLTDRAGQLNGAFEYRTDLFDRSTIERMVGHLKVLLEAVIDNPQAKLYELPLLTKAEKHQLLVEWNDTKADYPSDMCIHQLFEEQVEKSPQAIAVVFEGKQLTYAELNAKANQLAHYLRKLGVGPEMLVAICVERSLDMVIGLLGILKSGGAYVPLDPDYPQERLAYMLADAAPAVVLTQSRLKHKLLDTTAPAVELDGQWGDIAQQISTNPDAGTWGLKSSHLAYVIYTSGSTGWPKGVELTHGNAVAFIAWCKQEFSAEEMAQVLAITSISFDLSIFEIFSTLTMGGTVLLVGRMTQLDIFALQPSLINTVPSGAEFIVLRGGFPGSLKALNLAGEALNAVLIEKIFQQIPYLILRNLYGPSEDTTYSIQQILLPNEPVTIGRPIANTQIYILDAELNPVPIGVAGEIHIGGAGLARGYLNRPELTTERFLKNPFNRELGTRMYKTGDLGRYRADGNIEFLGRNDDQVKIRGYRIELGEIEVQLNRHEQVREAVVFAREDIPGEKKLVAYLILWSGESSEAEVSLIIEDLRKHLKEVLPEYMVPSAFVTLDSLPLTSNRKLDRKALPIPDLRAIQKREYEPPRGEAEESLARIWQDILHVERVGRHDNFFELGGDSLSAVKAINRINTELRTRLPVASIFKYQCFADLAKIRSENMRPTIKSSKPGIVPKRKNGDTPLTFNQEVLWTHYKRDPKSISYNIPLILHLEGTLYEEVLETSLKELILRHEALRTYFQESEGKATQLIASDPQLPMKTIDLSNFPIGTLNEKLTDFTKSACEHTHNLIHAIPIYLLLIKISPNEFRLIINLHHIIADGWSTNILLKDLLIIYASKVNKISASLPILNRTFADFSAWQRENATPILIQDQVKKWEGLLRPGNTWTDLPRDSIRSEQSPANSFVNKLKISSSDFFDFEFLNSYATKNGTTVFTVILTAFFLALRAFIDANKKIVVGVPIVDRPGAEFENVIGFFLKPMPVVAEVKADTQFLELCLQLHAQMLILHSDVYLPIGAILPRLIGLGRSSPQPVFNVRFNYHNEAEEVLHKVPELQVTQLRANTTVPGDVELSVINVKTRPEFLIFYDESLFEKKSIDRLGNYFIQALKHIRD